MSQSDQLPVFDRQGNEIGVRRENTIQLSDGSVWNIVEGNVYAEPGDNLVGQVHGNLICSFTGEVQYSLGEPFSESDDDAT